MADPPSRSLGDRWFPAAAAGTVLISLAYLVWMLTNLGGTQATVWFDDIGEMVAAFVAAAACVHAARGATGPGRRAWWLMAGWGLSWGLGEAVWCWYQLLHNEPIPFPSLADAGFLGAIPFAVLGVLSFPAAAARGRVAVRLILDGLTVAAALLSVSWATVLGRVYASGGDGMLAQVLSLAYPISDVVLCTMLLVLAMRAARGAQPVLVLLSCGLAVTALADSAFAYLTANGTYGNGNWIDTGWVVGFLLVALAALRSRTHPVRAAAPGRPGASRLYLPYVPVAVALVLACDEEFFQASHLGHFLFVTMLALVVIVVTRQVLTLSDNVDLIRRLSDRERQLEYQASHDPLTDLANRVRFRECVGRALTAQGPWRPSTVAVLFIDLDDFKDVNDRLGHHVGDHLLVAVADRLRTCVRPGDVPARLGGDEFAVLVTDVRTTRELLTIADGILDALRAPVMLGGALPVSPQGTIGIAIAEATSIGTDELLRRADVAMYAAKARGKGVTGLFEPSLEEALRLRFSAN